MRPAGAAAALLLGLIAAIGPAAATETPPARAAVKEAKPDAKDSKPAADAKASPDAKTEPAAPPAPPPPYEAPPYEAPKTHFSAQATPQPLAQQSPFEPPPYAEPPPIAEMAPEPTPRSSTLKARSRG